MAKRDIVVIGASAGGIDALRTLVGALPRDLASTLMIVLHTAPASPNILDRILERAGHLPAVNARDGDPLENGKIYVAPADFHLLVEEAGHVRLSRGPRENRFRPSIDVLFRSAAYAFGARVVGVVLSGWLDDGVAGLRAIKARGGVALVQDPQEAAQPSMPLSALQHVAVDHVAPAAGIARLIETLGRTTIDEPTEAPMPRLLETEVRIAREEHPVEAGLIEQAPPSHFTCPECHGVLMEIQDGDHLRFRCHTGHAYTCEALADELGEKHEATLWSAVRSLDEIVFLLLRMADSLESRQRSEPAARFRARAEATRRRCEAVRATLMQRDAREPVG